MSKKKVVENPNFGKGVYNCQTTVKDLMDMLKQFPEDLTVQIVDSSNPYAWLDVKLIERVNNEWIDTLEALKSGKTYTVIDGNVIVIHTDHDEYVGKLQEERD